MVRQTLTREEAAAARSARIEAAQAVLDDAVAGIRSGEDWKRFLDLQSRLHGYSANNVMLVCAQHLALFEQAKVATPLPSYIASYNKWQELGRQVEKGQTGLAVIAPMRGTKREAVDGEGNIRPLSKGEATVAGEREVKSSFMRGFTVEKVFADTQTTGDPLPEPVTPKLLRGDAPRGLGEAIMKLIEDRGFTVTTVPSKAFIQGANGITRWDTRQVQVRDDMDDAAMVKTLIHEAAHVVLHDPTSRDRPAHRGHLEVEAESVAFIVARVHGMETDDYSFAYVAGWAGEDHAKVLAKTAQRVAACAKELIAASPAEHSTDGRPAAPAKAIPDDHTPEPAVRRDEVLIGV
jgi:hypothetical protein